MNSKLYLNIYIPLIIILLSVMGAACSSREAVHELQSIERIIPENPDSALSVLEKNSTLAKKGREAKALYSLLLTEARYKTAIRDTADSLIRPAVEYYGMSDDDRHRAKTFFMAGNLDFNAGEYGEAVINCLRAEKSAMQAGDHLMLGLIYRLASNCFEKVMDMESVMKYRKLSYRNFKEAGDDRYTDFSLIDLARVYQSLDMIDTTMMIADYLYDKLSNGGNAAYLAASLSLKAICFYEKEDYKKAVELYEMIIPIDSSSIRPYDIRYLGRSYVGIGEIEKARECNDWLNSLDPNDKFIELDILEYEGEYRKAIDIMNLEVDRQNDAVSKVWHRNFSKVIDNFYRVEHHKMSDKLSKKRIILFLITAIAILVILMIAYVYVARVRSLKHRIEEAMDTVSGLRKDIQLEKDNRVKFIQDYDDKLCLKDSQIEEMNRNAELMKYETRKKILECMTPHFKTIEALSSSYHIGGNGKKQKNFNTAIKEMMEGLEVNGKVMKETEKMMNEKFDNIIKRLRNDYPRLSDSDIHLFIMYALNFPSPIIAYAQNTSADNIYSRKYKLRQKIEKGTCENKAEYLGFF